MEIESCETILNLKIKISKIIDYSHEKFDLYGKCAFLDNHQIIENYHSPFNPILYLHVVPKNDIVLHIKSIFRDFTIVIDPNSSTEILKNKLQKLTNIFANNQVLIHSNSTLTNKSLNEQCFRTGDVVYLSIKQ